MNAYELISQLDMINTLMPNQNLIVGGQPSAQDLRFLAKEGIHLVINLRPETEKIDFDQVALLADLGIKYVVIPVTTIETFTKETAVALSNLLADDTPCLVHCASGNRVGALIALKAYWIDGESAEDSMEKGLQAGLTKYKTDVAKLLSLPS